MRRMTNIMEEQIIKRILPHSAEAEQSVIGAILLDSEAIITASEILLPEDFYNPQFKALYSSMLSLYQEGRPIDPITLENKLREQEVPEDLYRIEFISQILSSVPTSANIKYYAEIVKEKAILRRLIRVSESIANELWSKGLLDSQEAYQSILDGTLGVHPTFLYESLWNLLGLGLLLLLMKKGRRFNGQMFLSYVIWYGLGRAVIEGLRTDSLYFFGTPIRSSQMLGLLSAAVGIGLFVLRLKTAGPATPPLAAKPSQAAETPGPSPAPAEPVATEEMEQLPEDTEHSAPAEAAEAPSQPEEEQKEEISDGGGNH